MKNCQIIFIVILLCPKFLLAQIYSGIVIDKDSKEPLVSANIFLAGTLTGTTTNKEGRFEFNLNGNASVPIVISYVGYITKVLSFDELKIEPVVGLEKEVFNINEIDVKSNPGTWSRRRMMQVFKEEFLGRSFNAQACKIKNEDDIYLFYNDETEVLHAKSGNPIIIENKLLGYRVYYLLEYFRKSVTGIQFKGYSRFEEIENIRERKKVNIDKHRRQTYLGSVMHFIRYLYNQNLSENDTIYDLETINQIYIYHASSQGLLNETFSGDLNYTSLVSKNDINNILLRKYEDKFQMYDKRNNYLPHSIMLADIDGKRNICFKDTIQIVYLGNMWKSYMVPKADTIEIFKNGNYDPEKIGWFGTMSKQRVGDLLPLEYKYDVSVLKD